MGTITQKCFNMYLILTRRTVEHSCCGLVVLDDMVVVLCIVGQSVDQRCLEQGATQGFGVVLVYQCLGDFHADAARAQARVVNCTHSITLLGARQCNHV